MENATNHTPTTEADDSAGYFFGLVPILAGSAGAWWAADAAVSTQFNRTPGTTTPRLASWYFYDKHCHGR